MSQILLVDDEAVARKVISAQVEKLGHTVFTAASAEEAEAIFSEHRMDMALVDLRLGEKSGLDLLTAFKDQEPDCQVVLITAYASVESAAEAMRLGASDYLVKPVQAHDLLRAIKSALKHKRVIEENRVLEEENRLYRNHLEDRLAEQTAELRASEERYRKLVDTIPDAIVVHSEGKIVYANPGAAHIFAASNVEKLLGMPVLDLAHPESLDIIKRRIRKTIEYGEPAPRIEEKLLRLDGSAFIAEVRAVPTTYHERPAIQAIIHDITERKRAEEAIKESEQRFRAIFETIQDLYYRADIDGTLVNISPSCLQLTGYSQEELIGTDITTYYADPDQRGAFLQALQKNGAVNDFEVGLVRKDGTHRIASVTSHVVLDQEKRPVAVEGIARDITERKKSEKSFRNLVESAFDAIIVHKDMKVLYANPAAQKMFGANSLLSVLGRSVLDYVHPCFRSFAEKRVNQVIRKQQPIPPIELKAVLQTGEELDIDITSAPITYADNEAVVSVVRDITERKRREEAIIRLSEENSRLAQQMILAQDKERHHIAQELHDELGQSLTLIKTEIARAASRSEDREELAEIIATIDAATDEVITTTRNMFNRLRPTIMDGMSLMEEIEAQVKAWERQYGVVCNLDISGKLDDLEEQVSLTVYRIVQECLTNIAKHASARKVDILFHRQEQPDASGKEHDTALIVVADDGKGMDLDKLDTKGLGLVGMRERAHAVHGELSIKSSPGKGTRVSVTIPLER